MPSTFTDNGGIEKIGLGEQAGTWGTTTNTNFDIIDRLINGVGTITLSGTTHTLTTSDGSLSDGMFKVLQLAGSPSGTNTITISPNNADKLYFVKNGTSQTATFTQGSGGNVSIAAGKGAIIFADGAGSTAAVTDLTALFTTSQAIDGINIGANTPGTGAFTALTVDNVVVNGSNIGHTDDTDLITVASGAATVAGSLTTTGDILTSGTLKASGDTSTGQNAAIGFTSSEGIIITGQGSTNDVTIKNDADTTVIAIPTGGTGVSFAGTITTPSIVLGSTTITSTAAEINILDGVTASTSEINILNGVTASTSELNIMNGVTATTAELNVLDGYTGSVTELNYLDTLHATGVTSSEFDFLDGVTSNIQTQLNTKVTSSGVTSVATGTGLTGGTITSTGTISLDTTLGAVGTYAMLGRTGNGTIIAGETYTNSSSGANNNNANLVFSGFASDNTFSDNTAADIRGNSVTGVWRAMGHVAATGRNSSTLFLRIS
jgi:hypothetical protein